MLADFFGNLERLAADLYPYRFPIGLVVLIIVAAVVYYAYRKGLHLWAWQRRLWVTIIGVPVLVLLGITIPPIGAIYIVEAMLVRRFRMDLDGLDGEPPFNYRAFGAWFGAIAVGHCSDRDLMGIVGIASIDSLIVACALYAAFQWRRGLKINRRSRLAERQRTDAQPPG